MSQTQRFDAVVIGGGHNGLVAAAYLARAGRKTLLLEAQDWLGGMAASRELAPGVEVPLATTVSGLSPKVASDLSLARHGFQGAIGPMETVSLLDGGRTLHLVDGDAQASAKSIAAFSERDAAAYPEFQTRMARLAGALSSFLDKTAPTAVPKSLGEKLELVLFGLAFKKMGTADMRDFLRIVGMNIWDLVDEKFENPALRGAICFDAVKGNMFGPRSPNTVFTHLFNVASGPNFIARGGTASLLSALESSARASGVEIRTGAPVAKITVDVDRASGVELEDGTRIEAGLVFSCAHPSVTLLKLVGPEHLDADYTREVRHARSKGANARVDLLLGKGPQEASLKSALAKGRVIVAPSDDMLERSFDHAKYGELPPSIPMEAISPTMTGQMERPNGRDVLSVTLQYTPSSLKEGEWSTHRDTLVQRVKEALAPHWSGFAEAIEAATVTTPDDLEAATGNPGGHWHQLELGLDQILMLRPVPGWARYSTPVSGLYLCGAGTHPGGGLTGRPGANAVRQALSDLKKARR